MKKLFLLVLAVFFALRALPHTESEMLDVARRMVHIVDLGTSYDHIDDMLANYREWGRPEVFFGINYQSTSFVGTASERNNSWRALAITFDPVVRKVYQYGFLRR